LTESSNWPSESASPSLGSTQAPGRAAYELKFVFDETLAAKLEQEFSSWLTLDPHADPALNHCYRITSIYTDTPRFDVFHRHPGYQRSKFRVRRYGEESRIYFEKKTKRGQRVRKARVSLPGAEIGWLGGAAGFETWTGNAYRDELSRKELAPVCQISYLRRAYFACTDEGRLRLTFDRDLRGFRTSSWGFDATQPGVPFSAGRVICEFKFQQALPTAFKRAIEEFGLTPAAFSKYRSCMDLFGIPSAAGDNACA
jgi:hypothetical protein